MKANIEPGRGKSEAKTQERKDWEMLVRTIRDSGMGPEHFEPMLAELIAHPPAHPHHTPEWKRKHLRLAFREAGVEL